MKQGYCADSVGARVRALATAGPVPTPPLGHTWESLMDLALDEARMGAALGEVPVGAVLVGSDGTILARAHNEPVRLHDPTAHAEVLALRRGGQALGNYRLRHAVLVVTLEPCLMCTGALVHSRVAGVVYGAADVRAGAVTSCCEGLAHSFLNHTVWHMGGVRSDACAALLRDFFRDSLPIFAEKGTL